MSECIFQIRNMVWDDIAGRMGQCMKEISIRTKSKLFN